MKGKEVKEEGKRFKKDLRKKNWTDCNTLALLKKQTYGADRPSDWRLAHCLRALVSVEKKQYPGYSPLTITDIVSEWI
ncbi:MAG: hypothetical protein DRH10_03135 [Deltaproteobacteria bacterium]|nr:MAG: hypothetical protein DRH10_03135 [Deltaproteobacteria bacterium]